MMCGIEVPEHRYERRRSRKLDAIDDCRDYNGLDVWAPTLFGVWNYACEMNIRDRDKSVEISSFLWV